MNNSTYPNNLHGNGETFSVGFPSLDTAYLQTTATPTGMQSAKLGQVTKYLRVIGQQGPIHCVHCSVADIRTNWLQYFAAASGHTVKM